MRNKVKFIAFILIVTNAFQGTAEPEWNLAIDKEGIQIYTRYAEGCPLNEFKGVTMINASMQTIMAVLRDVNRQSDWMCDCLQSNLLKTFSADHMVVYNLLHLGWPLSNRDLLIDVTFNENQKAKKLIVDMTVFSQDIYPVSDKYVRIRDFKASCIVEEVSPNLCKVVYQNRVNPMAPVPAILANTIVKNNPFNTLKGMKRMVMQQKYQVTAK